MFRSFSYISLLLIFISFFSCTVHEDNSFRNAIGLYAIRCTGGSTSACQSSCSGQCGVPAGSAVTTDKIACINTCQSNCSTNCDLSFPILIYLARKPIK